MAKSTWIRKADWIVAWNDSADRHEYLRDADIVFEDGTITFVGRGYEGDADEIIGGGGRFVIPGLIDIHAHPSLEPSYRGIREEHGVPEMYMTGLYERSVAFWPDADGQLAGAEAAYCELLKSGVTTIADLSMAYPGWIDLLAKSGLRGFLAPGYASARWKLESRHQLGYAWDEAAGRRAFEQCLALVDEAGAHPSGRLSGMIFPMQIDTCTEELLRDSAAEAERRDLPLTTHLSQSVNEFLEMVDRHGVTPVQWARDIGFLGPRTSLGHAIFIDDNSWLSWPTRKDVAILAETDTTVAHCPSPFARYGQVLESFGRYRDAGVKIGMGTDVAPHNLIEEMRLAAILSRVAGRDVRNGSTAEVFRAATVGGAKALLRDDIGRLAAGAKADIVVVDAADPLMMPARDPLRSLVYTAADRAIRDVYVDGRKVVDDGRVLTLDHDDALGRLAEAQARMEADVAGRDWAGRNAQDISPLSLPLN